MTGDETRQLQGRPLKGICSQAELREFLAAHAWNTDTRFLIVQAENVDGWALLIPHEVQDSITWETASKRYLPERLKGIVGGEEVTVLRFYRPGSKAWTLRLLWLRASGYLNDRIAPEPDRMAARAAVLELRSTIQRQVPDDLA